MGVEGVVAIIAAIVGSFGTLAAYLTTRDKRNITDAKWQGSVDAKLDIVVNMSGQLLDHEKRLTSVERDVKTAFRRHDENIERINTLAKQVAEKGNGK